jgi:hypothetical protein
MPSVVSLFAKPFGFKAFKAFKVFITISAWACESCYAVAVLHVSFRRPEKLQHQA